MGKDINTIRQAVLANRGGLQNASDSEIMTIWNSLDEQTREKYLQSINKPAATAAGKERKVKDAVGNPTKRDV